MFEKKLQPVFITSDKQEFKTADEAKNHEVEIVFTIAGENKTSWNIEEICSLIVNNAAALVPILQQGLKRKYNKAKKVVSGSPVSDKPKKVEKPARAFGAFEGTTKAGE